MWEFEPSCWFESQMKQHISDCSQCSQLMKPSNVLVAARLYAFFIVWLSWLLKLQPYCKGFGDAEAYCIFQVSLSMK